MSKKKQQPSPKPPGFLSLKAFREATKDLPDHATVRGYEGEVEGIFVEVGNKGVFLSNKGEIR